MNGKLKRKNINYNDKTFERPDGTLENGKKTGEIRLQRKWDEKYKVENTMILK